MVRSRRCFASHTELTVSFLSLDTRYSLESCGGCSSMGEFSAGVNCLALPNSSGVGCDNGTCVVFSCKGTLLSHRFEICADFSRNSQLPTERQRIRLRSSDLAASSVQRQHALARCSIVLARLALDFSFPDIVSPFFVITLILSFIIGSGPPMCSIELSY